VPHPPSLARYIIYAWPLTVTDFLPESFFFGFVYHWLKVLAICVLVNKKKTGGSAVLGFSFGILDVW